MNRFFILALILSGCSNNTYDKCYSTMLEKAKAENGYSDGYVFEYQKRYADYVCRAKADQ